MVHLPIGHQQDMDLTRDGNLKIKKIEEFTDSEAHLDFYQAIMAAGSIGLQYSLCPRRERNEGGALRTHDKQRTLESESTLVTPKTSTFRQSERSLDRLRWLNSETRVETCYRGE